MKKQKRNTPEINKVLYYFMFLILIFVVVFISNTQHLYSFKLRTIINVTRRKSVEISMNVTDDTPNAKYILLWTSDAVSPFIYFGKGNSVFVNKKCKWTNCVVTSDRNYLGYYTEFDVIAFNGPQLPNIVSISDYPSRRSARQKYVYANIEAASNYPIDTNIWNDYFNWTWTYKLNSDAVWGYVAVRDASNDVIGPRVDMHWLTFNDMEPINDTLKQKLKSKTKAAAWFSSNCYTKSQREEFVKKIQEQLHKYNLEVDVYGSCGTFQCPRDIMDRCLKVLQKHYYFYFAFENALSEDYVTEKIVYALNHDTVPIVFGGANYTRFMPPGIYLNALELGPEGLAKKMNEIIQSPEQYHNFFRWQRYYSFQFRSASPDTDDYCRFCAMANDDRLMAATSVYGNFTSWWADHGSGSGSGTADQYTYRGAKMFPETSADRYSVYQV